MPIPYYPNSSFWSVHPVFIGSLFTVIAIIVAVWIGHKEARRKGLNLRMFYISALWMGAGALLGGRTAYFLLPGPGFLDVMHHGFHSVGVILGGFFGFVLYGLYRWDEITKKQKFWDWMADYGELWVYGGAIGTFFYRIGCFLIHCIEVGIPSNLPWAVIDNGVARHPVNIYYSLAGLVIFVMLIEMRSRRIFKRGIAGLFFIIFYTSSRFILDFFREQGIKYFDLSFSQIIFLIFFIFMIILFIYDLKKYKVFIQKRQKFYAG